MGLLEGGWVGGLVGWLVGNKYASCNTGDVELEDSNDQAKKEILSLESIDFDKVAPNLSTQNSFGVTPKD